MTTDEARIFVRLKFLPFKGRHELENLPVDFLIMLHDSFWSGQFQAWTDKHLHVQDSKIIDRIFQIFLNHREEFLIKYENALMIAVLDGIIK